MRDIFCGGLAATIAGVIFLGVGGRIAMRVSALLNPEQRGAITESEAVVGDITVGGTIALIIFGGILGGFVCGVVWLVVREWLPRDRRLRPILTAFLALAAAGAIVESGNIDFALLDPPWLHVVMFAGLFVAAGALTAVLDPLLDARLPRGEASGAVFGGMAALGGLAGVPFALGVFFANGTSNGTTPPWPAGLALIAVAVATVAGWVRFYRRGESSLAARPRWQRVLGFAGVPLFGVFGLMHLAGEIAEIV